MQKTILFSAFHAEVAKMRYAEKEVVSLLPRLIKAVDHAPLALMLSQHRAEAQHLLSMLTRIKNQENKGAAISPDFQELLMSCAETVKAVKRGVKRDLKIISFAEKIIGQEIECCSCLISLARNLGYEDEAESMHKNLHRKEALEKKLNAMREKLLIDEPSKENSRLVDRRAQGKKI